jgi:serine/threonine protein kinase
MVLSKIKSLFTGGPARVNVKERFVIKNKSTLGTMSEVFKAFDKKLGKQVCLKILDREKTEKFEARFAGLNKPGEGAISAALQHPHIVEAYEHGLTTADEPYLVMEWIAGDGLLSLIESEPARLDGQRVRCLQQLADALEYMHQQKYLHRDICPRNVIVTPEWQAKLIDFGLSVPYRPDFCKPGNRTGTPQYLAPEVLRRAPTDHRVDLFALGVTAYETFTGQLPWGPFESVQLQLSAYNRDATDPREHLPELDDAIAQFLLKSVEREAGKRFQTAAAFRDALKKLPKR